MQSSTSLEVWEHVYLPVTKFISSCKSITSCRCQGPPVKTSIHFIGLHNISSLSGTASTSGLRKSCFYRVPWDPTKMRLICFQFSFCIKYVNDVLLPINGYPGLHLQHTHQASGKQTQTALQAVHNAYMCFANT